MSETADTNVLSLTARIVAAHVENNQLSAEALPDMIQSVFRALASVGTPGPVAAVNLPPAVPVKKSVFPDFIICLEDGQKLKMLKRHLKTSYNMTPADYRAKWGLPSDYPMVAPSYAATRSRLAKSLGLGRKSPVRPSEPDTSEPPEPEVTMVPARRARGAKG